MHSPFHLIFRLNSGKVDWKNIESAWEGGVDFPQYINGLFSDDNEIVTECTKRVWWKIEYQGTLYEATYVTALIVARMLPYYKQTSTEQRLLAFIHEVMAQPNLERDRLHAELLHFTASANSAPD